jgi:hypothetical protein
MSGSTFATWKRWWRSIATRSACAKALGSVEFQDEAQKKTLEANLLAGEELQALSKEVVVQPPEIIAQIRKLMGK